MGELLPGLPDFFQRALNANNTVASDASELEVASAIAEFYEMGRKSGEAPAWDTCIPAAIAGNPFCAPYAQVLAEFSRKFCGGHGSPIVKPVDAFAKQYNCNARLGEDFLRSVIEVTLHPEKSMGRVRQACLATNLTSPKIVDGIARLLTSNDLLRLKKTRRSFDIRGRPGTCLCRMRSSSIIFEHAVRSLPNTLRWFLGRQEQEHNRGERVQEPG